MNKHISFKGYHSDSQSKIKQPAMNSDVDWAVVVDSKPLSTGITLVMSFVTGCQLPKDVQRRQLQVWGSFGT